MSYLDQSSRRRPATIAAVTIVHLAIGYAIISGLAITVIRRVAPVIPTQIYEDPKDPPTRTLPPPQRATHDSSVAPTRPPLVPTNSVEVQTVDIYPHDVTVKPTLDPVVPVLDPPKRDFTRAVQPGPGRASWVTTDDYPPQPLREGIKGAVAISVQVGADGRVQGCAVTKSSGNAQLDDATCRLYARRAHFQPALDAEGKPVASVHADRIRWELPAD
jgi:protein TonB